MHHSTAFKANAKFYADEDYPYGIDRSGEFTVEQCELLLHYGVAYEALDKGLRQPVNDEERRFVAVCRKEKAPVTVHERTWMHFCLKTQQRRSVASYSTICRPMHGGSHDHEQNW